MASSCVITFFILFVGFVFFSRSSAVADLVGDLVGGLSGTTVDIISSWIECITAALLVSSQIPSIVDQGRNGLNCPFVLVSCGVIVALFSSFMASHVDPAQYLHDLDLNLRLQLVIASVVMIPVCFIVCLILLPARLQWQSYYASHDISNVDLAMCSVVGVLGGLCYSLISTMYLVLDVVGVIFFLLAEYYTSYHHAPVRQLAWSATSGAATEIMFGIANGYGSTFFCAIVLSVVLLIAFYMGDVLGLAYASLGIVGILPTYLILSKLFSFLLLLLFILLPFPHT